MKVSGLLSREQRGILGFSSHETVPPSTIGKGKNGKGTTSVVPFKHG
jgi:hypothetical protein